MRIRIAVVSVVTACAMVFTPSIPGAIGGGS